MSNIKTSQKTNRVLARNEAKELNINEIKQVSGGGCTGTAEVTFGPDGSDGKADVSCTF